MDIALLVDIGVVAIIMISAAVSFFRGFVREVLTILGVFGGGFAALAFGAQAVPLTSRWFGIQEGKPVEKIFDLIPADLAAQIAAYAGIFLLVFIVLQLASFLISNAVQAVGLGPVDRTLGVFFGIARGLLLLGILYLPFHLILPEDSKKDWFEKSKTMVFVEATTNWLTSFVPSEKGKTTEIDSAKSELNEKLNKIDILGNKRLSQEEKSDAAGLGNPSSNQAPTTGYSDKAREGLENLIMKEITPKNNPQERSVNE